MSDYCYDDQMWTNIEKDGLPISHCIVRVKCDDGTIRKCYFHKDAMSWVSKYCKKELQHLYTGHFQDYETHEFLHNVVEWYKTK